MYDVKHVETSKGTDTGKGIDDYEASKVIKKDSRVGDEERKAVEALNAWGGGADDDDDDF